MLNDKNVVEAVKKSLNSLSASKKLQKWEKIAELKLLTDKWSPESGLLTEVNKNKHDQTEISNDIDEQWNTNTIEFHSLLCAV